MNRLKELRESKDLTKVRLSEISGISRTTLSALENGKRKMTPNHARILSKIFDCDPSFIMGSDMMRLEMDFKDSLKAFLESMLGYMFEHAEDDTLDESTRLRYLICEKLISEKLTDEHLEIVLSMINGIIKKEDKQ